VVAWSWIGSPLTCPKRRGKTCLTSCRCCSGQAHAMAPAMFRRRTGRFCWCATCRLRFRRSRSSMHAVTTWAR